MPQIAASPFELLPFALLLLAVLGLWIGRAVWIGALVASIAAAYWTGALNGLAAVWIAILAALALAYRWARERPPSGATTVIRIALGLAFFVFALAMALVMLPGFPRTTLTEAAALTPGAVPYGIGLGFPKVTVGILVLGILNTGRVRSARELGQVLQRAAPLWLFTVVALMAFTLAMGYVRFEPKWTSLFLVWAVTNLFFTCMSEEAFFRGFVQHELAKIGSGRVSVAVAIAVAAVLFGLIHFAGGPIYVIAGVIAGVGYGIAYHRTQRIEAAMAVHFAVNATHFLLFTYPALA